MSVAPDTQSTEQLTLQDIITDPKLLRAFDKYLQQTQSHQNLLFIEAMSQLRHEEADPAKIERMLHRIYKTFIQSGACLQLKTDTQDQVKRDFDALRWAIIDRHLAISILKDTEEEVSAFLNTKLSGFLQSLATPIGSNIPSLHKQPKKDQKRVVIIGGGFTGFTVASVLDPMPLFHVTLIDTKDSFEYTPGIVNMITNPEKSSSLRVLHEEYVRNGRVIIGYADYINDDATSVQVNGETILFDYLVIATGSSYTSQLKSTDVSSVYRVSGLKQVYDELVAARRILIVGAGLVGCELAAEIAQRKFPGPYPEKQITLVELSPTVIPRSNPHQQQKAMQYLNELGVEIICNEKIMDFNAEQDNIYQGSSGRIYSAHDSKVFMATGTRPNSGLLLASPALECCLDDRNRIRVKPTLQLSHWKYQHIFAGGDVTNVIEEKTGYSATIAGVCIARNICRLEKGKPPLTQGSKGLLPAPIKPLHGIAAQGGIGKKKLSLFMRKFSFLNPTWTALKYFDEQQFVKIVQDRTKASAIVGRLPRKLPLRPHHLAPSQSTLPYAIRTQAGYDMSCQSLVSSPSPLASFRRRPSYQSHHRCSAPDNNVSGFPMHDDYDDDTSIDAFSLTIQNIHLFDDDGPKSRRSSCSSLSESSLSSATLPQLRV
ncbi:hypothetical protein EC973_003550 [Apophysomyces ossiformis]|uniref:RGS domain-containing protein n=1 Tax=Apophysomyces ossiformis TaxID=679940 RepID=A0A8H7BLL1_9FUNG|nr:hypothetical protein EC973_003550 [Apophysomyces ossiformis]